MQNNQKQAFLKKASLTGIVTSDKMQKTVIVKVTRLTKNPKYKKVIKKYQSYKVHDEKGEAKAGDTVRIIETRPISKDKRWRLLEVMK